MLTFQKILLVGLGGFIGSVLRYLASGFVHSTFKATSFPVGTALVNLTGCLIIGLLGGWTQQLQSFNPNARLFLFLGLLGAFTTFSAFGYETMALVRDGELLLAFANVGTHLLLGCGAVFLGLYCSNLLRG